MSIVVVVAAAVSLWAIGGLVGFDIALLPSIILSVVATAVLALLTRTTTRRR